MVPLHHAGSSSGTREGELPGTSLTHTAFQYIPVFHWISVWRVKISAWLQGLLAHGLITVVLQVTDCSLFSAIPWVLALTYALLAQHRPLRFWNVRALGYKV